MTGRTHDLVAFSALVVAFVWWPQLPTMTLATAITAFGANFIGGLFPQIDQKTSDFWDNFRSGPFVAKVVCPFLGGHRNLSHSLVGVVLIGAAADWLPQFVLQFITIPINEMVVWVSFMIGFISHLVADGVTRAGIPLFWPLDWQIGFPPVRALRMDTGKFVEKYLVFPGLLLFDAYLLYAHQARLLEFFRAYLK